MKNLSLIGAVLVGGRSKRFGRAKWSEPVGGVPMVERATAALAPHVREVVALAPDREVSGIGLPLVHDVEGGGGPLAALASALRHAQGHGDAGALVLACDLPLVDSGFLGALVAAWQGEDLVAPEQAGWLQPFCALWSISALEPVVAALASADRSPLSLAKRLRTRIIGEPEWRRYARIAEPLLNVNTPEELARAESLLSVVADGSVPGGRG